MSRRVIVSNCALISLALVLVCGVVPAQELDPCGPIPIPPRPLPVMKYVMASPRACLIGPPVWSHNAYYLPTGAAENFRRPNGAIRVLVGTRVIFCLSRDLEGVWYPHSYGCLGTSLVLQRCKCCKVTDCVCPECEPNNADIEPCPWVTIGRDGAKAVRKGPSIGRAKVGVPVRFKRPGIYYLRGIIRTFARPFYPLPLEQWYDSLLDGTNDSSLLPPIPPAEDKDIVYVRVRVVDWPIAVPVEPIEKPTDDPDVLYIKPMPKDMEATEQLEPVADLNCDEVINFADLSIMAQQWGKEYEMPFSDDE